MLKEIENYLQRIDDLHKQVIDVITDVPSDGLNFIPIHLPELQVSNSLAMLAAQSRIVAMSFCEPRSW